MILKMCQVRSFKCRGVTASLHIRKWDKIWQCWKEGHKSGKHWPTPLLITMQRYAYDGVQPSDSISRGPTCTNRAAAELGASILVYVLINVAYCVMLLLAYFTAFSRFYRCQNWGSQALTWPQLGNIPGTSSQSDQFRMVTDYFYPEYVFLIPRSGQ